MQQPAGERADAAEPLDPLAVGGDHAAHHVAVSAEVLRGAVQHEGGAELGRTLQHGGGEGVVDEHGDVARGIRHLSQVEQLERRVRRGLDDDQAGVGFDRRGDARGIRPRDARAEEAALEDVVGAAVERAHGDHVRLARGRRGDERGGQGGHAARERDRALGALEPGEGLLEAGDAGLPEALVDRGTPLAEVVAGGELLVGEAAGLDGSERVGGGEVDDGHVGTARSDPVHAAVDGAGLELRRRCLHTLE